MDKKMIMSVRKDLEDINGMNGIHILGYIALAKELIKKNYRKIPKNAVVITRDEWKQIKSSLYYSEEECERRNQKIRKEAAEKFAKVAKERLEQYRLSEEWEEDENQWRLDSSIFCAEVLLDGGLIDEICKEITEGEV